MTLRLITGAANAGKTGLAYAALKEQLAAGLRPVLLLPSGPDTERALAELSAGSPTGLRCMTFDRYIGDAWDQFGDGRAIISPGPARAPVRGRRKTSAGHPGNSEPGIPLRRAACRADGVRMARGRRSGPWSWGRALALDHGVRSRAQASTSWWSAPRRPTGSPSITRSRRRSCCTGSPTSACPRRL